MGRCIRPLPPQPAPTLPASQGQQKTAPVPAATQPPSPPQTMKPNSGNHPLMLREGSEEGLILEALKRIYPDLELKAYYSTGSTAHVYRVLLSLGPTLHKPVHKVNRIIKVFRPIRDLINGLTPDDVFFNEIETLASTSHTNLIAIYEAGHVDVAIGPGFRLPYYQMEYLPGAQDLNDWVKNPPRSLSREDIIDLILQACNGIGALHEQGRLHCDIKFGNLLVGSNGILKVADLGFSKKVNSSSGEGQTSVYTTFDPLPNCFKKYIMQVPENHNQSWITLPRHLLKISFDLHYLGWVMKNLLLESSMAKLLSQVDRDYLGIVVSRLDLDSDSYLPKYSGIKELTYDLYKMKSKFVLMEEVPELNLFSGTNSIRIPINGSIPLTRRFKHLIDHPLFARLKYITQLGLTYLVYPGAHHTRDCHSLGVYANACIFINSLLADDCQPVFRLIANKEKIATTLVAALLHDIGQHSFAHSLEDYGLMDGHEANSVRFILNDKLEELLDESYLREGKLLDLIDREWPEVNRDRLLWMISGKRMKGWSPDVGWDIMRSIIDGPIDADKLSYLLLDANCAGVEYAGSIDVNRFINSLTACVDVSAKEKGLGVLGVLGITWKGTLPAENIFLARMQLFWVLYWHHAVRSAHAMFAHAWFHYVRTEPPESKRILYHKLFGGSIGEILSQLSSAISERTHELATCLQLRRLYKRVIELDVGKHQDLYLRLLQIKEIALRSDDPLQEGLAASIAEVANTRLKTDLKPSDFIIDIPIANKDRLSPLYVYDKETNKPQKLNSRILEGGMVEWQNRARIARVFINPDVSEETRKQITKEGFGILLDALA